ncbi:hypothetical protein ACFQ67_12650 [Streptomyces sp. NPDC056488]|uniref:DUF7683 domain-containing protein n=1 Tax=unclassified Streptomyces TaxID=2593676 RepID=UPI0004C86076|nr:hypothetical protein [Streptomyces sp. NRRL S-237]
MTFLIARYEKDSDLTDIRWDVTHLGAPALRKVFGVEPGGDIGDVYRITTEHAATLTELTTIAFDLDTYEYYLEPEAD